MDSFMDMTLSGIVSEAVGNSGNGGKVTPQPKFSGKIDYIAQYEETCFEFLNRLSWIYGEWFFYDGTACYFGKKDGESNPLKFESEMTTFDLSANLIPTKMKYYHYLVHDDNEIDKEAPKPEASGYHLPPQNRSESIYSSDATLPSPAVVLSMNELEAIAKADKKRETAGMLTMSGSSQTCKVKIGGKIVVSLPKTLETTKKDVDTFLVTSVVHEFDLKGDYHNTFTAIPGESENIPMQPIYFPKAFSQLATVKSNDDEKKLGRVKVEFQWQKEKSKTTNWIRVKTPDAGKSDIVPKNRGFVFIPEKDDIVMIDFEYGDPNRPYVAGSIFSEKVSAGGKDSNKIKSITTRSGSTITFDDDENEGSITISDHSGNTIKLHGDKTISITAPDKITMTSKEIIINGSDLVHTISEKMIKEESQQHIESTAMQDVSISGTTKVEIGSSAVIEESAPKVSISGSAQVEMSGLLVDITATTIGNIKGMPLNLN
jgi:uncharacterized protein involved in type VI secretion and phage assembly